VALAEYWHGIGKIGENIRAGTAFPDSRTEKTNPNPVISLCDVSADGKSSGGLVGSGCPDDGKCGCQLQRSLPSRWSREGAQVIDESYAFMGADPSVYTFIRVATQTSIYRACL